MAWSPPVYTPGVVWQDSPSVATPVDAANLSLNASAVATYAGQVGTSVVNYLELGALVSGALTPTQGRASDATKPKLRDLVSYKDYGVKGGAQIFTSGATLSSTTLTDTTHAPFVAGDVGKTVNLVGANTGGTTFSTTVSSFTDTSHVGLTAAPPNVGGFTGAYQFGWDDTAAIQAAETALSTKSVALTLPPDNYMWSSVTPGQGIIRIAYGANVWQIAGQIGALWYDNTSDGVTIKTGFGLFGGSYHGEGQNAIIGNPNQLGVTFLRQWQWLNIDEITADGFSNSGVSYWNTRYTWTTRCKFTNCCVANYRNVISIDSATATGGSIAGMNGDHYVCDNYVGGNIPTAALNVNSEGGTLYGRVIITDNNFTVNGPSGSTCIFLEVNPPSGVESGLNQVIVSNNILNYTGSGNGGSCIAASDDAGASAYAGDPLKISEFVISDNIVSTNATGTTGSFLDANAAIICYVSRVTIDNNRITHTGTHGQALFVSQSPAATGVQQVKVTNNIVTCTNTTAFNNPIRFANASNIDFKVNTVQQYSTAKGSSSSDISAVRFDSSCSDYRCTANTLLSPGRSGFCCFNANMAIIKGNTIRNANASNDGASGGFGIEFTGAPTGARNMIDNNTIIDDAGTHLMNNGIQCDTAGSGTSKPWCVNNTIHGSVFAAIAGGSNLANYGIVRNNVTDNPNRDPVNPYQPTAPATTVAHTHPDPFDVDLYWSISGGSMTSATRTTSGGSALAVGLANPLRLRIGDAWTPTYSGTLTITKVPVP